jgi:hypothetical protein
MPHILVLITDVSDKSMTFSSAVEVKMESETLVTAWCQPREGNLHICTVCGFYICNSLPAIGRSISLFLFKNLIV